jgi:hypothetical protein
MSTLPEAAFSLSLKGTLGDVEAMLTIRGATYADFAANVAAVEGLLDARTTGPTAKGLPDSQPPLEGWCHIHDVQMTMQHNDRGSWWSHKTADGWCRGKAKQSA